MVIEIENIGKSYGAAKVVEAVGFAVEAGDYFGLLGPNGSGKSTLIALMLGLVPPDAGGSIRLFGEKIGRSNIMRLRGRIGVVGEAPQLRDERTVADYLDFFARLYGLSGRRARMESRLAQLGLGEEAHKRVRALSRGLKQRLSLARALLHDPELLLLDEPINGLDPQGVRDMRELLQAENRHGTTVFLCSHLLSEVEKSCKRIAVIHRGLLRACGPMAEIAGEDLEKSFLALTAPEAGRP